MVREPLITVGMPVYNAMPWLPEAIESLLAQSERSFEILAIVDGATDDSATYLRSLRDPRLRVLEQPRAGVTATLNRLLRETHTPWMARQDADDVSYPRRIRQLLTAAREHPEAAVIYSLADYHPRERCTGRFRCSRGSSHELRSIVKSGYLLSLCHSTAMLQIEKVRAAGGYRMDIHAEDADLWWRLALRHEIHCIPEALVGFRLDERSVSARHAHDQQIAGLYVQYLLLSDLWGRQPRTLSEIRHALQQFLRPQSLAAKEFLRQGNMHLAAGQRRRAAAALLRALLHSPGYVLGRVHDEFRTGAIRNGVSPQLFWQRREALWP